MIVWIRALSLIGSLLAFYIMKTELNIETAVAIFISFSILAINITVGNICEVIRRTCRPETIYYYRTADLIKTRIFWNIGIHVTGIIFSSLVSVGILATLKNNWWTLGVLLLGSVLALITTPTTEATE